MQDSIWLIVVTLLISSGAGFLIGMLWQKNRTPATDSSLAAKLAGLEATERELRAQLAKSEQTISTQAQQTDKENKILVQLEPVKQQLLQMQDVVQRLEKERTE